MAERCFEISFHPEPGVTGPKKGGAMSRQESKHYRIVAALVEQGGRFLVTQRCAPDPFAGRWEFPVARVEPGQSDEDALQRELRKRLDIDVTVDRLWACRTHAYPDYSVLVVLYKASIPSGQVIQRASVGDYRWVSTQQVDELPFVPADQTTEWLIDFNREHGKLPPHPERQQEATALEHGKCGHLSLTERVP
jgi:8-oxo-dGTP diphosphatase